MIMIEQIPAFDKDSKYFNVIIEITEGSCGAKYEYNNEYDAFTIDRFMTSSMNYPCNYGFIPNTKAGDTDPIDVLLVCSARIMVGSVIRARPIGILTMEDESGQDEKILSLPIKRIDPIYSNIDDYQQLSENLLRKIEHFFKSYKDLDKNKWSKIGEWKGQEDAWSAIIKSVNFQDS